MGYHKEDCSMGNHQNTFWRSPYLKGGRRSSHFARLPWIITCAAMCVSLLLVVSRHGGPLVELAAVLVTATRTLLVDDFSVDSMGTAELAYDGEGHIDMRVSGVGSTEATVGLAESMER